jgi:putative ABC transport system substrate-binding protein
MPFDQLKRRNFITLLGGAASWPLTARAQERMALIGFLAPNSASGAQASVAALLDGLKQAG